MSPHAEKLHPLTSLRFFAAAMIVLYHSAGLFGFPQRFNIGIFFDQAVSFFFVLSGFILTYVYPRLDTFKECRRFWFARFARVWPAHLAAFVFFGCALGFSASTSTSPLVTTLNLLLVQAWIPIQNIFFSYNPVSWSISTEVAFYLVFPFLIRNWERTWAIKLLMAFSLALGSVAFANHFSPPTSTDSSVNTAAVSFDGLTYINPLGRLFEFTLGMSACLLFRRFKPELRFSPLLATVAESAALFITALMMYFTVNMTDLIFRIPSLGPALAMWSAHGPICAWSFALLILTLAFQRGWISRLLSAPVFILLGELSFSIYLLHFTLRDFYGLHSERFDAYPGWLIYTFFWAILLVLSWLVWAGFERPMRVRILALWGPSKKTAHDEPAGLISSLFFPTRATFIIASLLLALLCAPATFAIWQDPPAIDPHIDVAAVQQATPPDLRDIDFGNVLKLLGFQTHLDASGLQIELTWRSLGKHPRNLLVGIHLVDAKGNIVKQGDYVVDSARLNTPFPWTDTAFFAAEHLHNAQTIGIVLYQPSHIPFRPNRGPRDWENHRLLIPFSLQPATTRSN